MFIKGRNYKVVDICTLMTSITIRRPSTPAFNPGTPTTPAGSLKRSRINFKPSTAVLLARPSRSLVSAGRNLDRTLALKDCAFDIAEICGKSGRRSERIIVRTALRRSYWLLKASPQGNRTMGSGKYGSLAIRRTARNRPTSWIPQPV